MEHIKIRNLGPISECDVDIEDFLVFTGPQASGKSTVSKAIFFFNDLESVLRQIFYNRFIKERNENTKDITEIFKSEIKNRFIQIYGDDVINNESEFYLSYTYNSDMSISLEYGKGNNSAESINVVLSDGIIQHISDTEDYCREFKDPLEVSAAIGLRISGVLGKTRNVVYVPAGRSILTSFGSQIDYVYLSMGLDQRDKIDYCMRHFIELAIKIRPSFENGTEAFYKKAITSSDLNNKENEIKRTLSLMEMILQGQYRNSSGVDYLDISDSQSIKLGYASSGQQEAVWILNILFYYLIMDESTMFIIEEPESHLFPDAQKHITELISLVKNGKNKVILTTHSPYVLGSINNLLYVKHIAKESNIEKLEKIIPCDIWLDYYSMGAYYLKDGKMENICDDEYQDINHDVIDGASRTINDDYEKMVDIKFEEEEVDEADS